MFLKNPRHGGDYILNTVGLGVEEKKSKKLNARSDICAGLLGPAVGCLPDSLNNGSEKYNK